MNPFHSIRPATLAAASALILASSASQAITLVGLTSANEMARIDTVSMLDTRMAITGLSLPGERLVGVDTRPSDGMLYAVSTASKLYTINAGTGAATWRADLSAAVIDGSRGYGIDFNPVADYGGATSLRLVSSSGDNFAINANTGVVGNAANKIASGYSAVAYTNSMPLAPPAPASTALYYIDSSSDMLRRAGSAFNTPTLTDVGALGIDVLKANGFDIAGNGMAYAALTLDDSSLATGLYSIDLGTGQATLLRSYQGTLSGLTVSAVPEPGSYALMAAGLALVGLVARRRRG
ncbi:DUF4394 domain-containing protein [Aquabacterium sp. OR-4]|uniref:DUF4394 domain-containing protein n=1 Tax=Aquabacterium sp. OR-4 TaxID=2978127 RepID=UPI0021B35BD3|nr:DUF4394 domain-containing protein [Aquabacterium sp. OR-4]MDT7835587.1 DUF4394 domain-containing protein [Aquabacterium sp. OR-4]